jgi:hypothetical protein
MWTPGHTCLWLFIVAHWTKEVAGAAAPLHSFQDLPALQNTTPHSQHTPNLFVHNTVSLDDDGGLVHLAYELHAHQNLISLDADRSVQHVTCADDHLVLVMENSSLATNWHDSSPIVVGTMWNCAAETLFRTAKSITVLSPTRVLINTTDASLENCIKKMDLAFDYTHPLHMEKHRFAHPHLYDESRRLGGTLEGTKAKTLTVGSSSGSKTFAQVSALGLTAKCIGCYARFTSSFRFKLKYSVSYNIFNNPGPKLEYGLVLLTTTLQVREFITGPVY